MLEIALVAVIPEVVDQAIRTEPGLAERRPDNWVYLGVCLYRGLCLFLRPDMMSRELDG